MFIFSLSTNEKQSYGGENHLVIKLLKKGISALVKQLIGKDEIINSLLQKKHGKRAKRKLENGG